MLGVVMGCQILRTQAHVTMSLLKVLFGYFFTTRQTVYVCSSSRQSRTQQKQRLKCSYGLSELGCNMQKKLAESAELTSSGGENKIDK